MAEAQESTAPRGPVTATRTTPSGPKSYEAQSVYLAGVKLGEVMAGGDPKREPPRSDLEMYFFAGPDLQLVEGTLRQWANLEPKQKADFMKNWLMRLDIPGLARATGWIVIQELLSSGTPEIATAITRRAFELVEEEKRRTDTVYAIEQQRLSEQAKESQRLADAAMRPKGN